MFDYIKQILEETDTTDKKNFKGTTPTLATANIFQNDDPDTEEEAEEFHSQVAQLLFLCKQAQPDI